MTHRHCTFLTTSWDLVAALHQSEGVNERALDCLSRAYWPPIYGYLRRKGFDRHTAADLTQGYFTDVVLTRKLLHRARPADTPLRSLILTSLQRYLTDKHRRSISSQQRNGSSLTPDMADRRADGGVSCDEPEAAFHRRWAVAVIEEAVRRCEQHFMSTGRQGHWEILNARIIRPILCGTEPPSMAKMCSEHGFVSPGHASAALQVAKKRVIAIMKEIVGETVPTNELRDQEFQYLVSVIQAG